MKKLHLFPAAILLLVPVFGFTGGKAEAPGPEKPAASAAAGTKTLGVAMIDITNPCFVDLMKGGDLTAAELNVNVIWKSFEGSLEKEISIIENFIEQKVDCILIDPVDSEGVKPSIKKAYEAGIPLVTMGNFVETPWKNVSTLYNDYVDYYTLTKMCCYYLGGKGKVVHLYGKPGNFVSDERLRGFEDAVKEFPGIVVLAKQPAEWDPVLSQKIMEDWLAAYPEIDALLAWHDGIMYSAVTAIKNAGRLEEIAVFSYDGDPEAARMVESGELIADLLIGCKRIGAWNVMVGDALARGAKLNPKVFLPSSFIIKPETLEKMKGNGFAETIQWLPPAEAVKVYDEGKVDWAWK